MHYFWGWGCQTRGRPKRTWKEVVNKNMANLHLMTSDATSHSKWMEMISGSWSVSDNGKDDNGWSMNCMFLMPACLDWPGLRVVKWVCCSFVVVIWTWGKQHYASIVYQGAPWSWNLGRPFSRPGKSWKIAKVMESHGKVMEYDDNVMEFLLLHWAIL